MYHKLRNTLAGLGVVLAMFTSGVLFSDPLPAKATATPVSAEAQLTTLTLAVLQTVIAVAQAEAQAQAQEKEPPAAQETDGHEAASAPSRLRLELGMPFYSFGTVLPRRRES